MRTASRSAKAAASTARSSCDSRTGESPACGGCGRLPDDVVAAVLNLAVELLEQQRFIVPSEKFMLLRVVSLALCLLE